MAEQRFDPGLVCGGAGAAEARRDGAQGPELPCGAGTHLGAVVGHDQQDRLVAVAVGVAGAVGPAGLDALPQAFGVERVGEHDFDLCGGLLDADVGGRPICG